MSVGATTCLWQNFVANWRDLFMGITGATSFTINKVLKFIEGTSVFARHKFARLCLCENLEPIT